MPHIGAAFKYTNRVPEIAYNYFCPEGYFDNPDRYKEQPQRDEDTVTAEIILNHISRMENLPPQLYSLRQVPRRSTKRQRGKSPPNDSTTTSVAPQYPYRPYQNRRRPNVVPY